MQNDNIKRTGFEPVLFICSITCDKNGYFEILSTLVIIL